MSSDNLRLVDARMRMQLRGTETVRGTVVGTPVAGMVTVLVAGANLSALVPLLPVDELLPGMVVELERPRGVTGRLHVVRVLG